MAVKPFLFFFIFELVVLGTVDCVLLEQYVIPIREFLRKTRNFSDHPHDLNVEELGQMCTLFASGVNVILTGTTTSKEIAVGILPILYHPLKLRVDTLRNYYQHAPHDVANILQYILTTLEDAINILSGGLLNPHLADLYLKKWNDEFQMLLPRLANLDSHKVKMVFMATIFYAARLFIVKRFPTHLQMKQMAEYWDRIGDEVRSLIFDNYPEIFDALKRIFPSITQRAIDIQLWLTRPDVIDVDKFAQICKNFTWAVHIVLTDVTTLDQDGAGILPLLPHSIELRYHKLKELHHTEPQVLLTLDNLFTSMEAAKHKIIGGVVNLYFSNECFQTWNKQFDTLAPLPSISAFVKAVIYAARLSLL